MTPPPLLSAIICTHNRAGHLEKALASLARQSCPQDQFEIIVVDNCSTDTTVAVCDAVRAAGLSVRYYFEPRLGISAARNTGWRNAHGGIVAYLDDDAEADSEWVNAILSAFEKAPPQTAIIGGRVRPAWQGAPPEWAHPTCEIALGYLDYGDTQIILGEEHSPIGANIAFRKSAIEAVGGFCEQLGRSGGTMLACEETFLERQLRRSGQLIVYDPDMQVTHCVHADRLNPEWRLTRAFWQGVSLAVMDIHDLKLGRTARFTWAGRRAWTLLLPPIRTMIKWGRSSAAFLDWRRNHRLRLGYVAGLLGLHRLCIRERIKE